MSDLPGAIEQLTKRLEFLERRVSALEHLSELPGTISEQQPIVSQSLQPAAAPATPHAGGAIPVLGKAMLGIAGAYLLRAVAESGSIPMLATAAVAIAYAGLWLVWAARVPVQAWFAGATYALTSAVILAPMLWELTVSFKVLPAPAAAAILAGFVIAASALAWKRNLAPVFWVANVTAALVAVALMVATHDMAPFAVALLLMAFICELAAVSGHALSVRPLVGASADIAIWALIFIYSGPAIARADYKSMGAPVLIALGSSLFLIYGLGIAIETAIQKRKITVFEIVQTMIAFLLAASCVLTFGSRTGAIALGIFCLILSAAGYASAFALFDRVLEPRNYHVFVAWSAALCLAGSWLCLPPFSLAACLGLAAILASYLGARRQRLAIEFHGLVYLAGAAVASGLLSYCFRTLAISFPATPTWIVGIVSACAVLCYGAERHDRQESWKLQLLHISVASLAICSAAALLISGLVWLIAFSVSPGAQHVAFIRTSISCLAALALAYCGAHWRRIELTRIAYATLVLLAVKLVFEDLRHGHLGFIAASISFYAVTLILVPRLARLGQRT